MRRIGSLLAGVVLGVCGVVLSVSVESPDQANAAVQPGSPLRVNVPEAVGGRTVFGQLTVARATRRGFVTAYGCDDGIPRDSDGDIAKSDLNFNGAVQPVASNRLIVTADADGDVCFYVSSPVELIVDVSAHTDGIENFANQRTDTRTTSIPIVAARAVLRVKVPKAAGAKTVVGQLTAARVAERGFVTAYGCDEGPPTDADGEYTKSDLNFNGAVQPVASNRLVVTADADGDICFYTSRAAALVVDVSGATNTVIDPIPNQRTDTRPTRQSAGAVLRVTVPEAVGSKIVAGQLTAARATARGFVTAYGCGDGIPRNAQGEIAKSDLNFNGTVQPVASNRLVATADARGQVCFYTSNPAALIVDINGVSQDGITSIPNQRTDTRETASSDPCRSALYPDPATAFDPEFISDCLLVAWTQSDRELAARYAEPNVVDQLFAIGSGDGWINLGCADQGSVWPICFFDPGPNAADGWRQIGLVFTAYDDVLVVGSTI